MAENLELLRGVNFFKPLSDDVLESIAIAIHEVTFSQGTRFISEGRVDDEMYIIVEGHADVTVRGRQIRTLTRGDIVGEMAAVAASPRTASVIATTRVRALVLSGEFLRDLMRDHPNAAAVLSREMSFRGSS